MGFTGPTVVEPPTTGCPEEVGNTFVIGQEEGYFPSAGSSSGGDSEGGISTPATVPVAVVYTREEVVDERRATTHVSDDVCGTDASANPEAVAVVDALYLACAKTARLSRRAARALFIASKHFQQRLQNSGKCDRPHRRHSPPPGPNQNIHARQVSDHKPAVRAQSATIFHVVRAVDSLDVCAERSRRALTVYHCRHAELYALV